MTKVISFIDQSFIVQIILLVLKYACFFAGDFNAHSLNWWPNGDTNAEAFALDNRLSTLYMSQLYM